MNILSSHTMMLGLTIVLIVVMLFSLGSLSNQWSDFSRDAQAEKVCYDIKQAMFDIYQPGNSGMSNNTFGERTLNLPDRIGGSKYKLTAENNTVFVNVLNITKFCKIDLPVVLSVSSDGGLTKIIWTRPNGNDVVEIKSY